MSLKGSKTEQNLKDAFAGESQANRRYLYFAAKADVEGFNDVSAVSFTLTTGRVLSNAGKAAAGSTDAMEESMLGMRPDRDDSSRLSCQIDVSEAMNGMVVRLPEFQM